MRKVFLTTIAAAALAVAATGALATTIEYTAVANGGGNYTLNFTVENDTLGTEIEWIEIYFGQTLDGLNFTQADKFSNLSDPGAPAGWASIVFQPSALDMPGQLNSETSIAGVAVGGALSGFSVSFDMAAGATYDHLWFNVGNFETGDYGDPLDSGYTQRGETGVVPEPATLVLLGSGLAGLGALRRRKSR